MASLEGRIALVTGASRGIGAAIARGLAAAGADVAVNYRGNQDAAEHVAASIRALGRRAEIVRADVSSLDDCRRMAGEVLDRLGPVDILVNNGGTGQSTIGRPSVTETTPEQLQDLIGQHAFGAFFLAGLVVPRMREAGRGDVIMISSIAAQNFGARMGAYSMAKAAMEALAYVLAKEERQYGIRVNVVAPGIVETDMGSNLARQVFGVREMGEMAARSPFGFVCQPEDIANAVVFLCSEEGRYITGQRLTVNGGGF